MRRPMKRRRRLFPDPPWRVERDETGRPRIVNQQGREPLRDEDPLERTYNLHLAAAAPELRQALRELAHLCRRLVPVYSTQWRRDGWIVSRAEGALATCRPPVGEVLAAQLERERGQLELEFQEVA